MSKDHPFTPSQGLTPLPMLSREYLKERAQLREALEKSCTEITEKYPEFFGTDPQPKAGPIIDLEDEV